MLSVVINTQDGAQGGKGGVGGDIVEFDDEGVGETAPSKRIFFFPPSLIQEFWLILRFTRSASYA